jgi:SAM-dependent methyltransferase
VTLRQKIFATMYKRASDPSTLPWHREEPPPLLLRALEQRGKPARALDVGCGEGVYAAYLARQGWSVVGVDFVPAALELARARAQAEGVEVQLQHADVLEYDPPGGFGLVLDSGCLHHLGASKHAAYRARLDRWLLPGGDFVLVHFLKRHALDWRPAGPRRVRKEDIVSLFAPMRLEAYDETRFALPFPMGPVGVAGVYWFKKA